jgi:hypothetical protein
MYSDNGGGLLKPETVAAPASGATVLIGSGLKLPAALISMIFLMLIYLFVRIDQ